MKREKLLGQTKLKCHFEVNKLFNAKCNLTFQGNDHVVFNGSFFYFHRESESIMRYDLATANLHKKKVPPNRVVRDAGGVIFDKLYGPQQESNYLDLATDENGIWAVFGLKGN